MTLKLSVIMPAYNAESFISHAIGSILNQKADIEYELLVVDDGSTDSTKAIVSQLASEHQNIRLLENTRSKGPSGARNEGLLNANGEYLAFLDADDLWLQNHAVNGIDFLDNNNNVSVVFYDFDIVKYDTKEVLTGWFDQVGIYNLLETEELDNGYHIIVGDMFCPLVEVSFMHLQSMFLRKSAVGDMLFNEHIHRSEDRDFNIRLAMSGATYVFSPSKTGIYYRHGGSLTTSFIDNDISTLKDGVYLFEDYLEKFVLDDEQKRLLSLSVMNKLLLLSYYYRKKGEQSKAVESIMKSLKYGTTIQQAVELMKIVASSLGLLKK